MSNVVTERDATHYVTVRVGVRVAPGTPVPDSDAVAARVEAWCNDQQAGSDTWTVTALRGIPAKTLAFPIVGGLA